jgi:hypothetical protein
MPEEEDPQALAEEVRSRVDEALSRAEEITAPYGGTMGVVMRDPVVYRMRVERAADALESLVARIEAGRCSRADADRVIGDYINAWRGVVEWIGGKKK